jgi:hypothetical protein
VDATSEDRGRILAALREVEALPLGELGAAARLPPRRARECVEELVAAGDLRFERHGRHRYVGLARRAIRGGHPHASVHAGRTCYGHLAGELGVAVTDALVRQGVLAADDGGLRLGPRADDWIARFGLDVGAARGRPLVHACLDRTERRYHVGGAFGSALAAELRRRGWLRPTGRRAVALTPAGRQALRRTLELG